MLSKSPGLSVFETQNRGFWVNNKENLELLKQLDTNLFVLKFQNFLKEVENKEQQLERRKVGKIQSDKSNS